MRSIQEYINFIGFDPVTLDIKNTDRVDLSKAQYVDDLEFYKTLKEVAYQSGYGDVEADKIVNAGDTQIMNGYKNVQSFA